MSRGPVNVELKADTYDRLTSIKGPLNFDQIINLLIDQLPVEQVRKLYQDWADRLSPEAGAPSETHDVGRVDPRGFGRILPSR